MDVNQVAETITQAPDAAAPAEPQVTPEAPKPQDDDFSRKFAALSRREKKLFEEEQRIRGDRQAVSEYQKAKELARSNPLQFLTQAGLSVDDLVQHLIKDGQPPSVEDEVKSIKAEIEAYKKAEKDRLEAEKTKQEQATQKQVIDNYKQKIRQFVEQDTDKFEAIHTSEAYDDVFEVIEAYFEKTGEILPIEKAAESVEAHLIDDFKSRQEKFGRLKKLGSLEPAKPDPASPQDIRVAPTLTNNITASSGVSAGAPRALTREESLREAARKLKWT